MIDILSTRPEIENPPSCPRGELAGAGELRAKFKVLCQGLFAKIHGDQGLSSPACALACGTDYDAVLHREEDNE